MPHRLLHPLIISTLLLAAGPAAADPSLTTAKQLFSRLAALPGLRADYREQKTLSLLVEPVVSEGTVLYAQPDVLVRVTRSPVWSSLVVREKSLSYRDGTGKQTISADRNHPARAFVQVFLDVVGGNFDAVKDSFTIKFTPAKAAAPQWELELRPRKKALASIRVIKIRGVGGDLAWIEIVESNGDRATTSFVNVDVSRRPTAAEVQALQENPQE